MLKAQKLAQTLGQIDPHPKGATREFSDEISEIKMDYAPLSAAFCVENEALSSHKLAFIVAGSYKTDLCAIMLCPKADILTAVMHMNILVRMLKPTTKLYSTIEISEDYPQDVDLEHSDPEFEYNRYLIADPSDFEIEIDPSFGAKFLVTTDDNIVGELTGKELLEAVKDRTRFGMTPLGVFQPSSLRPKTPAHVILRKKT